MAVTTSYKDIGAIQRKEGGSGAANTSYVDIGAAQRQETATNPVRPRLKALLGVGV